MLPSISEILIAVSAGIVTAILGSCGCKQYAKASLAIEISLAVLTAIYFFAVHSLDGFVHLAIFASSYSACHTFTPVKNKAQEMTAELRENGAEAIPLQRSVKRIISDGCVTAVALTGAILFLLFGPEASILKLVIVFAVLNTAPELLKRWFMYQSVKVFVSNNHLFIVSRFESRKLPFVEMKQLQLESNVDLLKLHPLLTLFTSSSDFTTGVGQVLHLHFHGEAVYLTVAQPERWYDFMKEKMPPLQDDNKKQVHILPFYHRKNLKRLLGKLYFSITVKGISAYTGLVLILYYTGVPEWLTAALILFYWGVNLYISDRVLRIAIDAEEITEPRITEAARRVFAKADIPNVKVYQTESEEYNGLAAGMNIGRAMITLTTATMKLSTDKLEAILAHEAAHVKKRDILWGQLLRLPYLLLIIGAVLSMQHYITNLEDHRVLVLVVLWLLIMIYPIYQSFYMQWMEVRADHLGSLWLRGGSAQMADGLENLTIFQEEALTKSLNYRSVEMEGKKTTALERDKWFLRFLEFTFFPHPPMYWRISSLRDRSVGWGNGIRKRWLKDRIKECFWK